MHWVTARDVAAEMQRITSRPATSCALARRAQFRRPHGPRRRRRRGRRCNFTENWISVDPEADYDATVDAIQEVVDEYPGLFRDVQTYLQERIKEVLTGSADLDRRARLRARAGRAARQGGGGRGRAGRRRRRRRPARGAAGGGAAAAGQGRPRGRPSATASSRATSPRGGHAGHGIEVGDIFARQGLRHHRARDAELRGTA